MAYGNPKNGHVTDESRDPEIQTLDPNTLRAQYLATAGDVI